MFLGASDGNGNALFGSTGSTSGDFTNAYLIMAKFRESDYAMEWQKAFWETFSEGTLKFEGELLFDVGQTNFLFSAKHEYNSGRTDRRIIEADLATGATISTQFDIQVTDASAESDALIYIESEGTCILEYFSSTSSPSSLYILKMVLSSATLAWCYRTDVDNTDWKFSRVMKYDSSTDTVYVGSNY